MQMQAMRGVLWHNINPAIAHRNFSAPQIHVELGRVTAHLPREPTLELREGGGKFMQLIECGVGRVAAGVIFCRPTAAGRIVGAEAAALGGEILIVTLQAFAQQRLLVDKSRKPSAGRHGRS